MIKFAVKFHNLNLNHVVFPRTENKGVEDCNESLLVDWFT